MRRPRVPWPAHWMRRMPGRLPAKTEYIQGRVRSSLSRWLLRRRKTRNKYQCMFELRCAVLSTMCEKEEMYTMP